MDKAIQAEFKLMQNDAVYQAPFDKLTQTVKTNGEDLAQLRRTWSEDKLRQLDQIVDDMGQLKYEMSAFTARVEELALAEDLEKLKGIVTCDYVLKDEHQNLAAEVGTKALQVDLTDLAASHSEAQTAIEKHGTQLMMLESFRATTSGELAERPDAAKFQDIIDNLKLGIRDCEDR